MTAKQLKGRFIRKVMMHMLFQIGGAVVIIGALFKILHLEIGPLTGGVVLGLGLGTEAIIFLIGGLMLDDVRESRLNMKLILQKEEQQQEEVVKMKVYLKKLILF